MFGESVKIALRIVKRAAKMATPTGKKQVDFVVCGVQKSGTTALGTYLRNHPQLCMAENKEVHFFDNEGSSLLHVGKLNCSFPAIR